LIAFSACEKKGVYDEAAQLAIDELRIKEWDDTTGVGLLRHESGLYYKIINEGDGDTPTLEDSLSVEYEGRLLGDSSAFSSANDLKPYNFRLKKSIAGWKTGLPLIKEGGRIRLVIPSPLGYKDFEITKVPKNSVLDFTIDLKEIKEK